MPCCVAVRRSPTKAAPQAPPQDKTWSAAGAASPPADHTRENSSRSRVSSPLRKRATADGAAAAADDVSSSAATERVSGGDAISAATSVPRPPEQPSVRGPSAAVPDAAPGMAHGLPAPRFSSRFGLTGASPLHARCLGSALGTSDMLCQPLCGTSPRWTLQAGTECAAGLLSSTCVIGVRTPGCRSVLARQRAAYTLALDPDSDPAGASSGSGGSQDPQHRIISEFRNPVFNHAEVCGIASRTARIS